MLHDSQSESKIKLSIYSRLKPNQKLFFSDQHIIHFKPPLWIYEVSRLWSIQYYQTNHSFNSENITLCRPNKYYSSQNDIIITLVRFEKYWSLRWKVPESTLILTNEKNPGVSRGLTSLHNIKNNNTGEKVRKVIYIQGLPQSTQQGL